MILFAIVVPEFNIFPHTPFHANILIGEQNWESLQIIFVFGTICSNVGRVIKKVLWKITRMPAFCNESKTNQYSKSLPDGCSFQFSIWMQCRVRNIVRVKLFLLRGSAILKVYWDAPVWGFWIQIVEAHTSLTAR